MARSNLLLGAIGVGTESVMRVAGDTSMAQLSLKLQKLIFQFFRRREQPLHLCVFHDSPTSAEASNSLPRHWCPFRHLNSAVLSQTVRAGVRSVRWTRCCSLHFLVLFWRQKITADCAGDTRLLILPHCYPPLDRVLKVVHAKASALIDAL